MTTRLYLSVAFTRLGEELRRLRAHLGMLDREERANKWVQSDYARLRLAQIASERLATEAEIAALEAMTDDEIVARFNPPPPEQPESSVRPADLLARGELGPKQVVVHRDPPPSYRVGEPAPVDAAGWAKVRPAN